MKKTALVILFSILYISPVFSADLTAVSKIARVTVYQDRALVTREARVELSEGQNFVSFEGLPSQLIEESLRASGRGAAPVSILSVEAKKLFSPEETNPRVSEIAAQLEKLQEDMKEIQSRQTALTSQRLFLDSVRTFSGAQIPKDLQTRTVPASEISGLSQFMLDSYSENGKNALVVEKEIFEKTKEISAKQMELYAIQSGQNQEKKTAVVSLDAKQKTAFDLSLTYLVPQASWHITYDAKVDPEKSECSLISYGNVRQWSGEDWKDVTLTLSSAKPAVGGRMPELSPWTVDFFEVYPMMAEAKGGARALGRANKMEMMALSAMDSVASEAPAAAPVEASFAQAEISQDLGSVTYAISQPSTVLSDNRAYKFSVKSELFKSELDYEATPKLSPYAFLHSKVTNDKDYSLAGGEVNIFVKDDYIGQSNFPTIGRNEAFDLYLGIDEEVKVKRTELVDKKKKSLLGTKTRKDFGYKIEMENYKKKNISLSVYDQLPVSKNGDIKVELLAAGAKPSETKDLGIMRWTYDLKPGEKKAFEFQFFVEYPADKNISGI